jgi:NAD(P)-dependent dehydrogenase (short-subunit alcohol dehydrogenase family)
MTRTDSSVLLSDVKHRPQEDFLFCDINVRGVFVATQAALKHMKSGGRIISIGSAVGERVQTPGLVAYSATKGAAEMQTSLWHMGVFLDLERW